VDHDLREAERRFAESGSDDDESRLIVARLRVGAIADELVDLAARLGHPAAVSALSGRVQPDPRSLDPWRVQVRARLARRLLDGGDAVRLQPHVVTLQGPPGTNDGRRFVMPTARDLRASIGTAELWRVEAHYGEGETALVIHGARRLFPELADFWLQVAPFHDEAASWADLARRLLTTKDRRPVRVRNPLEEAACGGSGFATDRAKRRLRSLIGAGPFTRALRLVDKWNEVTDVLESEQAYVLAHWDTSA
jgi:hypothetical protein